MAYKKTTELEILEREITVLTHKNELQILKHNQEVLNLKREELKLKCEINDLEISLAEISFQYKRLCNGMISDQNVIQELKLQIK